MTPQQMAEIHAAAFAGGQVWSAADIAAMLARPVIHAVATEHGFALLQVIAPEAELLTIAISPKAQGMGHGKDLLKATCTRAAALGAATLHLEVDSTNTAALALYARAGFAEIARRPNYYTRTDRTRVDALVLSLDLARTGAETG